MKNKHKRLSELRITLSQLPIALADGNISVNEYQDFYYHTYQQIKKQLMKNLITIVLMVWLSGTAYGQIDTSYYIDTSQNVSRSDFQSEVTFGELIADYNQYFTYLQISERFNQVCSETYGYDVHFNVEQIRKMEKNELVPLPSEYELLRQTVIRDLEILSKLDRPR